MHRCLIQRPTRRVICARLRPVTFTRNRRTIPFCPLFSFRYCWLFSVPSMKPYVPSLPSVEKQTFRFPSTNSFISYKLNRSKFCMVMFIYPQNLERLSLSEMKEFVEGNRKVCFSTEGREGTYGFIEGTLKSQQYRKLNKGQKGIVRRFLVKVTGLSRAQMTRLVGCWTNQRCIPTKAVMKRRRFARRYTAEDIRLRASVDAAHEDLSGPGVPRILQREFTVFGKPEFRNLADISAAHIYNLRDSKTYAGVRVHMTHTPARQVSVGERRKPDPQGQPARGAQLPCRAAEPRQCFRHTVCRALRHGHPRRHFRPVLRRRAKRAGPLRRVGGGVSRARPDQHLDPEKPRGPWRRAAVCGGGRSGLQRGRPEHPMIWRGGATPAAQRGLQQ